MSRVAMPDQFTEYYAEHLTGTYDCIDRIVINAYNPFLQSPGGFRTWWRQLFNSDETLDKTHLIRFAGHFSRRVAAYARKNNILLEFCDSKTRKHETAEELIPKDPLFTGLFCIMVARAPGAVIDVKKTKNGFIDICKQKPLPFVNHYSFHIIDKQWGHVTIRFCPHPPFNAMIILNGHEYVERIARITKVPFTKENNCFTDLPNAAALQRIADTMISSDGDVGRLYDVCERWIYSTCLCFALERTEQEKTAFRYSYSLYQAELSRNLLFLRGTVLDKVFNGVIDRTRSLLDVKRVKTIFGNRYRPHCAGKRKPRFEVVIEKPAYDMTVFKVHFDSITIKMYSKGAHVLRIETLTNNAGRLKCGKALSKFPEIITLLRTILQQFMTNLSCVDVSFIDATKFQAWPQATRCNGKRIAGVDINNPRIRAFMESLIALSIDPAGVTTPKLAGAVRERTGDRNYQTRQAAYDLKKFRAKGIVVKTEKMRYYAVTPGSLRTMTAYLTLIDKVLIPVINQDGNTKRGPRPIDQTNIHYRDIQNEMCKLFKLLKIAA